MAKKVSVCLTFDFDAMSVWIGTFNAKTPSAISRGEFGKVGAQRLLAMLHEWAVRSTWFVPGHTADSLPDIVEQVHAEGHEIAHHGYLHERQHSVEDERRDFERGIEALRRRTGAAPVGYRSPAAGLTPTIVDLLIEHRFLYDSSMMAQDFTPYYCRIGDQAPKEGPFVFGREVDLVELPFTWGLDDFPAFEYIPTRTTINTGFASPSQIYENWSGDFDYLYERLGQGAFILTMHPQTIGRGHRLLMLEHLFEHMRARDGVIFKTMKEVALEFKQHHALT